MLLLQWLAPCMVGLLWGCAHASDAVLPTRKLVNVACKVFETGEFERCTLTEDNGRWILRTETGREIANIRLPSCHSEKSLEDENTVCMTITGSADQTATFCANKLDEPKLPKPCPQQNNQQDADSTDDEMFESDEETGATIGKRASVPIVPVEEAQEIHRQSPFILLDPHEEDQSEAEAESDRSDQPVSLLNILNPRTSPRREQVIPDASPAPAAPVESQENIFNLPTFRDSPRGTPMALEDGGKEPVSLVSMMPPHRDSPKHQETAPLDEPSESSLSQWGSNSVIDQASFDTLESDSGESLDPAHPHHEEEEEGVSLFENYSISEREEEQATQDTVIRRSPRLRAKGAALSEQEADPSKSSSPKATQQSKRKGRRKSSSIGGKRGRGGKYSTYRNISTEIGDQSSDGSSQNDDDDPIPSEQSSINLVPVISVDNSMLPSFSEAEQSVVINEHSHMAEEETQKDQPKENDETANAKSQATIPAVRVEHVEFEAPVEPRQPISLADIHHLPVPEKGVQRLEVPQEEGVKHVEEERHKGEESNMEEEEHEEEEEEQEHAEEQEHEEEHVEKEHVAEQEHEEEEEHAEEQEHVEEEHVAEQEHQEEHVAEQEHQDEQEHEEEEHVEQEKHTEETPLVSSIESDNQSIVLDVQPHHSDPVQEVQSTDSTPSLNAQTEQPSVLIASDQNVTDTDKHPGTPSASHQAALPSSPAMHTTGLAGSSLPQQEGASQRVVLRAARIILHNCLIEVKRSFLEENEQLDEIKIKSYEQFNIIYGRDPAHNPHAEANVEMMQV